MSQVKSMVFTLVCVAMLVWSVWGGLRSSQAVPASLQPESVSKESQMDRLGRGKRAVDPERVEYHLPPPGAGGRWVQLGLVPRWTELWTAETFVQRARAFGFQLSPGGQLVYTKGPNLEGEEPPKVVPRWGDGSFLPYLSGPPGGRALEGVWLYALSRSPQSETRRLGQLVELAERLSEEMGAVLIDSEGRLLPPSVRVQWVKNAHAWVTKEDPTSGPKSPALPTSSGMATPEPQSSGTEGPSP